MYIINSIDGLAATKFYSIYDLEQCYNIDRESLVLMLGKAFLLKNQDFRSSLQDVLCQISKYLNVRETESSYGLYDFILID